MSKESYRCLQFIFILLLTNLLKVDCDQINQNGKSDLNANKISFLSKPVQLPSGVGDKDAISIHSTLGNFENQINQLRKEAEQCTSTTPFNCLLINNRLENTKDNFQKELNKLQFHTKISDLLSSNKKRTFFNQLFQIFTDYALNINFDLNLGPKTTAPPTTSASPTPTPEQTTSNSESTQTDPATTTTTTTTAAPSETTTRNNQIIADENKPNE